MSDKRCLKLLESAIFPQRIVAIEIFTRDLPRRFLGGKLSVSELYFFEGELGEKGFEDKIFTTPEGHVGSMIESKNNGMIKVLGYNLFYQIFEPEEGMPQKGTVLTLAGGPGCPHQYILPMSDLAKFGYRVVFYDQLGIGKSEMPKNKYMFSIEYNVEEVEALRIALNLGKINLWGSSYGGLLAIAYALKYQRNLKSLITAGGLASVPLTVEGMQKWKSELPPECFRCLKNTKVWETMRIPNTSKQ